MEATQSISSGGGTEASAPLTFEQAFAGDASPASDPSTSSTTPADAAVPPTTSEATPAPDDRSPFIPRDRFDSVNKRMQDAEAFRDQHKWAEGLNRDEIAQLVDFRKALQADPLSTLTQEIATLAQHPTLGPQLRSWLGRQLAARPQPQAEAPPQLTPIPLQLEDGRIVQVLPADQLAIFEQQVLAKAQQQFKPAMDAAQKLEHAERVAQAGQFASTFVGELKTEYPNFEAHKADVGVEVRRILSQIPATDPRQDMPGFLESVTRQACNRVLLPKLTQQTESKVLDSLQQKAAASTSVNPGSAAPSTPRRPASFYDPGLQWK